MQVLFHNYFFQLCFSYASVKSGINNVAHTKHTNICIYTCRFIYDVNLKYNQSILGVAFDMVKKQKNFSIDAELLQKLKHKAVEYNLTDGELICLYIQQGLQRDSNQTTLD